MPGLKQRVSGFAANGGAATLAVRKVADALKVRCVPSQYGLSLDAKQTHHSWLLLSLRMAERLWSTQHAGHCTCQVATTAKPPPHAVLSC